MPGREAKAIRRWIAHHRHLCMMVATFALLVLGPALPRFMSEAMFMVLVSTLVWAEGGHLRVTRFALPIMASLVVLVIVGDSLWGSYPTWQALLQGHLGISLRAIVMLFFAYCWGVILWSLLRARRITPDEIFGTVNLYILAAFIWATAYFLSELCTPGSFNVEIPQESVPAESHARDVMRSKLLYFSFITLASQGYGDITPQNAVAEKLVVLETIFGQFYVAVVVAYLVSMLMSQRANKAREP